MLLLLAPSFASTAAAQVDQASGPLSETAAATGAQGDIELEDLLVEGRRATRDRREILSWLSRLAGQFTYDGHVESAGDSSAEERGEPRGAAKCVALGPASAIKCNMEVSWTRALDSKSTRLGGLLNLDAAVLLLGIDSRDSSIRYLLVNSMGVAESGRGHLFGETFLSKAPCAAMMGNCFRTLSITAPQDPIFFEIDIDLEIDGQRVERIVLVQNRIPGT